MNKFTFKRGPKATGLAKVGCPYPQTDIKLKGKTVGLIVPPTNPISLRPDPDWRIRLHKADDSQKAGWTWITLKAKFKDELAARSFILRNSEKIIAIGLYSLER